jgi:hypothetical protein
VFTSPLEFVSGPQSLWGAGGSASFGDSGGAGLGPVSFGYDIGASTGTVSGRFEGGLPRSMAFWPMRGAEAALPT